MQPTLLKPARPYTWHLPRGAGLGGAIAGLFAGTVVLLLALMVAWLTGIDVWDLPASMAAPSAAGALSAVDGARAHGLGSILLGLIGAMLLGSLFGVIYQRVLHLTTEFGLPMYVGLVYGIMIFLVDYCIILPLSHPLLVASSAGMGPRLAQDLVFAVCLGLGYTLLCPTPYCEGSSS